MDVIHKGARLQAEGCESFRVRVTRACGHGYASSTRWNTERAAIDHGRDLVDYCVCSACHVRERERRAA